MLPLDLLRAATDLANSSKGKPRQAHLRRAVSTAYYALFHTLAKCCADTLIGGAGSARSPEAWNQAYRALDHGFAKAQCGNGTVMAKFPQEIQDFANAFVQMQIKRHDVDYSPNCTMKKSAVLNDIRLVERVINDFNTANLRDRRAFAAWTVLKKR